MSLCAALARWRRGCASRRQNALICKGRDLLLLNLVIAKLLVVLFPVGTRGGRLSSVLAMYLEDRACLGRGFAPWSRRLGRGDPALGGLPVCRGGEEDEVEAAWWFRGGCGRGRGEVVGVLRWSWLLLGRDGNAEQQQQQQTDTALSRWQLLRNPCCLACPELCEAEKRPNPNRLALRAPGLCRRQPNSQARAMPWWEVGGGRRAELQRPTKNCLSRSASPSPSSPGGELVACKSKRL